MNPTPPVRWHQLITQAEDLRNRTDLGLAGLWGLIHNGNYPAARTRLDQLLHTEGTTHCDDKSH